jgi:hypothetical protein
MKQTAFLRAFTLASVAVFSFRGGTSAQEPPTPTFGAVLEILKVDMTGTYSTHRMGPGSRLGLGLGSKGGYLTRQVVLGKNQPLLVDTYVGLPGATNVGVVDIDTEASGLSNNGPNTAIRAVHWSAATSVLDINQSSFGGSALTIAGANSGGQWFDSSGFRRPYFYEGARDDLETPGFSHGVVQAIATGLTAVAGILSNSTGNGQIALWSRPNTSSVFGDPTVLVSSRTGYSTFVDGSALSGKVYGWLDAAPGFPAQVFVSNYAEGTSPVTTLLGDPADLGPIEELFAVGSAGYAVGNRSNVPFLFLWSNENAGSGIVNDLAAVLEPGSILPREGTFVTGIDSGSFGGKDIGPSGNNAWIAVRTNEQRWDYSALDGDNSQVEFGLIQSGSDFSDSEVPDGLALRVGKGIETEPTDRLCTVRFEHTFPVTAPTKRVWFRLTSRNKVSNYRERVSLWNFSTNSWVELSSRLLPSRMTTIDVELPSAGAYVSSSGRVKALVAVRQDGPISGSSPTLDVEQARCLAEK